MLNSNNFDSLYNISLGKHFYQFYKSSEDFLNVMIPFFQSGLEKGEACLWLVSNQIGLDVARSAAQTLIVDFDSHVSRGRFELISAEGWYLTDGSFDESKAINNAEKYLMNIRINGFNVLRGAGDGGCIQRRDWPDVYAYEKKMALWIKSQPVIALCAYPILECTPSQTKQILECHEDVLVGKM